MPGLKSRLAERLSEEILTAIKQGRWKEHLPSERQLAVDFQVCRPTLHAALCILKKREFLRNRKGHPWVLATPSKSHVSKRCRSTEIILLSDSPAGGETNDEMISTTLITGSLRHKLHRLGYGFRVLHPFTQGTKKFAKALSDFDASHYAALYLLLSLPPSIHQWFMKHQVPAIILGSRRNDITLPAVDFDVEASVIHAIRYLTRRSHKCIALLTPALDSFGAFKFKEAFMVECAQSSHKDIIGLVQEASLHPGAVESAIRKLFSVKHKPTAVIATTPELANALYTTLGMLGLHIPRNVSIVVCGHWPLLDFLRPLPTCYKLSWETFAARVTRTVSDYLKLGIYPNHFWKLLPTFREGCSVRTL